MPMCLQTALLKKYGGTEVHKLKVPLDDLTGILKDRMQKFLDDVGYCSCSTHWRHFLDGIKYETLGAENTPSLYKRASNYLHKTGINLVREQLKELSQICALYGQGQTNSNIYIHLSPLIWWASGSFGDSGSCFWHYDNTYRENFNLRLKNVLACTVFIPAEGARTNIESSSDKRYQINLDYKDYLGVARCYLVFTGPKHNMFTVTNQYGLSTQIFIKLAFEIAPKYYVKHPDYRRILVWDTNNACGGRDLSLYENGSYLFYPSKETPVRYVNLERR